MVYIIKSESELQIITVQPEKESSFLQGCGGRVIVAGDSIPDALAKFNELPLVFSSYP
jgi:hypothetical protein